MWPPGGPEAMRAKFVDISKRPDQALRAFLLLIAIFLSFGGLTSLAQAQSTGISGQSPPAPTPGDARAAAAAPGTAPSATQGAAVTVTKTTVTSVTKSSVPGAIAVHTDLPSDLSVEGMFRAADPIVKGVMGLLALASVATWTIGLYKFIELTSARTTARSGLRTIASAGTLGQVSNQLKAGPVARLVRAAELEWEASDALPAEGIKERVAIALQRTESEAARRISAGTGVLASVGSTGPFVGLFGTVWGIMNSFIHISNAHTTNLSVVAPGIAEALLATAMGLVAAIPAVLIYNVFSRAIAAYRALLGDASAGVMRHVSRDLDRGDARAGMPMAAE